MSAAIKVEISETLTPEVLDRFRNIGEDLFRSLRGTCSVSIDEIDAATSSLVVRNVHKRDLGVVTQAIERASLRRIGDSGAALRGAGGGRRPGVHCPERIAS